MKVRAIAEYNRMRRRAEKPDIGAWSLTELLEKAYEGLGIR